MTAAVRNVPASRNWAVYSLAALYSPNVVEGEFSELRE